MSGTLRESPAQEVAKAFRKVPLKDHPQLLAFCEQRARLLKDREAQRALQAYRKLLASIKPPAND